MQRIVTAGTDCLLVLCLLCLFAAVAPAFAQTAPPNINETDPLLPPGVSDYTVELYGKLAYLWPLEDGTQVTLVRGDFSARMGEYRLASRDAVVWITQRTWQDRPYVDLEVFLFEGAEIVQPSGTIETGPALLVTLRSFAGVALNVDSKTDHADADSELYQAALKARGLGAELPESDVGAEKVPYQVTSAELRRHFERTRPPKKVSFTADRLLYEQHEGRPVALAMGSVYVAQGSPAQSGEFLELQAASAVVYLRQDVFAEALGGLTEPQDEKKKKQAALESVPADISARDEPKLKEDDADGRDQAAQYVTSVYLEGDVVLRRGQRMIRADRLYYDFANEKALILDVVTRALDEAGGLPIYCRADLVRQLSATEYEARNAVITSSEFHTPHAGLSAERVTLVDRTPRNEKGEVIGIRAGTYQAYDTAVTVEGVPLLYWPYSRGDFSEDRMAFRNAKFGYSSDFGATIETQWYLFNLLGLQAPAGYDATARLDYFTDRGPAAGVDMDYARDDYYGLLRSYYINDHGDDDLGGDRGGEPDHENRGRFLWRHRQYFPKDWELTLETAYVSDDQYMESYERGEFENGKPQETLAYLLKRWDNQQFSTLLNWRINEFQTETEHLPDARHSLLGQPLGEAATLYHDARLSMVRYRPDNNRFFNGQNRWDNTGETGTVLRGDAREELQFPIAMAGPFKLTPYVTGRVTAWDDTPDSADGGGEMRLFGAYGLRGFTMLSRIYEDVKSELFDLNRLRHIVKLDFAAFNAHADESPYRLTPFDPGVEDIDDFGGVTAGVRQRFQTKRGAGENQRTVDWLTVDVESGFFTDPQRDEDTHGDYILSRPEESLSSNFINGNVQYRLSDTTALVYDGVYDPNRGNMGTSNVSFAVEHQPRFAWFVGWRYIHDTDNGLVGFGSNYKLSEKHTVAVREYYDINEGRNFSTEVIYMRRWPRWYTAVALDVDRSLEDVGVNFSIWPEGAPKMGLGSKRYTGLADSVGIQLR